MSPGRVWGCRWYHTGFCMLPVEEGLAPESPSCPVGGSPVQNGSTLLETRESNHIRLSLSAWLMRVFSLGSEESELERRGLSS